MIDIVIPHYGDDELLERCLGSIEENVTVEHRVIVIDNNEENRGFAKACNAGIEQGDGEYVLLLNNDTVVPAGALARMQMIASADRRIAAVGPLSTAPAQWQWVHNVATWLGQSVPQDDYVTSDVRQFPGQLAFWCALIPRRALYDVGLLDEQFFMYAEDDDWCLRAQEAGYRLALDLGSVVMHHHRTHYSEEVQRIHEESFEKFKAKWADHLTTPPTVHVAVLQQGYIRAELAGHLLRVLRERNDLGQISWSFPFAVPIANNRNQIVLNALTGGQSDNLVEEWGAAKTDATPQEFLARFRNTDTDYLMMIDDDVVPYRNPLDLIPQMEERGIKIVGLPAPIIQYSKRPKAPVMWNVMNFVPEREPTPWQPINLDGTDQFLQVDAVGTGCIIIHRSVLEHPDLLAPFARKFNEFGVAVRGLDLWFCEKAQDAGFDVYTHTGYPCEHYWEVPIGLLAGIVKKHAPKDQGEVREPKGEAVRMEGLSVDNASE